MISVTSLSVKVGDLIIPAWRRMVEFLASLPVLPGAGVLITNTPRGTIVNARSAVLGFSGSFSMGTPVAGMIVIGPGYCNAEVPTISGVPLIPEKAGGQAAKLKLKESDFDTTGRSWICLEIEVDAAGKPIEKNPLRIVQAKHPFFTDKPTIGRFPLAVLFRADAKQGLGRLHRIVYHDLQHRYDPTKKRHFFFV
jgi:hypothetical protein